MKKNSISNWLNNEKTQSFLVDVFLIGAFIGGIATIMYLHVI